MHAVNIAHLQVITQPFYKIVIMIPSKLYSLCIGTASALALSLLNPVPLLNPAPF